MTRLDFEKRIRDAKEKEAGLKKQSNRMSTIRLVVFLSGAALACFCFRHAGSLAGWLAVLAALVLFVIFVRKHQTINTELDLARCMISVNQEYLDRITGEWSRFSDRGNEFVDPGHPYTSDLDIFGEQSLFQAINTAKTWYGRNRLAERLRNPMKDSRQIAGYQNAVKELAKKLDFCQTLQCEGMLNKKTGDDPRGLITYAEDGQTLIRRKWLESVLTLLPAITLVSLAFFILNLGMPPIVPGVMILIQLVIMAFGVRVTKAVFSRVVGFKEAIMAYGNIIRRIEDEAFSDPMLAGCKSRLSGGERKHPFS